MPNWCSVNAVFYSDHKDRIKKLKEELLNKKDFSFNKIIPSPYEHAIFDEKGNFIKNSIAGTIVIKDENISDDNKKYVNFNDPKQKPRHVEGWNGKYIGYKGFDWYSWNMDHYGVKWEVNQEDCLFSYLEDDTISVQFFTPWTYPEPVLKAICFKYKVNCEFNAEESGSQIYDVIELIYDEDTDGLQELKSEFDNQVDFRRSVEDPSELGEAYKCLNCDYIAFEYEMDRDEECNIICGSCSSSELEKYA